MGDCEFCDLIEQKKNVLLEDELSVVLLPSKPASPGHCIVVPRQHITILEQLSDKQSAQLGILANKISIIQFESLQAVGTNVLLQNGTAAGQTMPHVAMHVIPRFDGDSLSFAWKSKPLNEEQMASAELAIKSELDSGAAKDNAPKAQEHKKVDSSKQKVSDALLASLQRIP